MTRDGSASEMVFKTLAKSGGNRERKDLIHPENKVFCELTQT